MTAGLAALCVVLLIAVLVMLRRVESRLRAEVVTAARQIEARSDVMLDRVAARLAAALRDDGPGEPSRHLAPVADFSP